uniref:Uncharacterized protein n=1 Tax=Molossus molossus TaxID=27622 RepID=A0A7J8F915_MOLMO|nr:hypothetical protein HJG59_008526 [Molossus molossus]
MVLQEESTLDNPISSGVLHLQNHLPVILLPSPTSYSSGLLCRLSFQSQTLSSLTFVLGHSLTPGAEALACPDSCSSLCAFGVKVCWRPLLLSMRPEMLQIVEVLQILLSCNTRSENYERFLTLRSYLKAYLY